MLCLNGILSCFSQLSSNFTRDLVLIWFNTETIVLLDAAGGLVLSSDNPFDFHAEIWSLLAIFWNIYRLIETVNNFACHHLYNDFYQGNNLNQTLEVSLLYLCF